MTPKIKQGNSVPVKFTVMENGEQKDMSAATDLAWTIRHAEYGCRRTPSIVIEGGSNPYTIVVKTTVENLLGNYFLALSYTENGESRSVDAKAFELAAHSAPCSCLGASEAICLSADTCIGARGPAGTIEAVTASVDNTEEAPNVEVELGGTPEMRTIGFRFSGLKSTDGLSAYEIAVRNGFIGTESEWLESLHIPQNLVHTPGDREDAAMSQKGATDLVAAMGEPLAHSACTLEERVAHLEQLLLGIITGKVYIPKLSVKELSVWGDNNLIIPKSGAPTLPPDRAGQLYIDTKNNAAYKSTGNAAVADWKIL